MSSPFEGKFTAAIVAGGLLAAPFAASPARASEMERRIADIEAQLAAQGQRLADQERRLAQQQALVDAQGLEIGALRGQRDAALAELRAGQRAPAGPAASGTVQLAAAQAASGGLPGGPVGQAPAVPGSVAEDIAAVPQGMGVLTPRGTFSVEPSFEFTRSSANRLVFRGVEVVPGVQIGLIDATDADRDTVVGAIGARYGLTDRLEISAQAPYVYRHDRVTIVAQRDDSVTRTKRLTTQDIGDVEVSARYQLSRGLPGRPIFVANARVKPPTGTSPYDVTYDEFGAATALSTGSGFWGAEFGATMLYPTDPAVIFASLSYLYNLPRDIDRTIGEVLVGRVDPGDSVGGNIGFGLALNPRFSISLGYSHNFILPTKSELGGSVESSNMLQVGALQMGWSFRLTERLTFNNNFEFGVTSDAPDMRMVLRIPYKF
jgi:uncharacterized coiled-coil protein SlyX